MLTYSIDGAVPSTLYEQLYRCIKNDILSGVIASGDKLPSKRSLAKNLCISTITVEHAYGMLMEEGYLFPSKKRILCSRRHQPHRNLKVMRPFRCSPWSAELTGSLLFASGLRKRSPLLR